MHIFPQAGWHDTAYIVANAEALIVLRDAITRALEQETPQIASAITNDGEGYDTVIIPHNKEWTKGWNEVALPYTADMAKENRENALQPWKMHRLKVC